MLSDLFTYLHIVSLFVCVSMRKPGSNILNQSALNDKERERIWTNQRILARKWTKSGLPITA